MRNKILLFLIMGIMLMGIGSAYNFDNTKSFSKNDSQAYGKIEIKNIWGLGSTIVTHELKKNTNICLTECSAYGTTTLYKEQRLFDNLKFKKTNGEQKLINYKIYLVNYKPKEVIINDYGNICGLEESIENQTGKKIIENKCRNKIIGNHKETIKDEELTLYSGKNLPSGTYEWKIVGNKKAQESIDWIANSNGFDLNEWAWWQGTTPIGYWRFNEAGGNASDSSGNGWNLENADGNLVYKTGKLSNGINITGNAGSYFRNKTFPQMGNQSFTIAFWFNHTATGSGNLIYLSYGDNGGGSPSGGKLSFYNYPQTGNISAITEGDDGISRYLGSMNITLNDSLFHRVVLTRGNSSSTNALKFYVDGSLQSQSDLPTGTSFNPAGVGATYNLAVGANAGGTQGVGNAILDDLQIYNVAWSTGDVGNDWNSGSGKEADGESAPEGTTDIKNLNSSINYSLLLVGKNITMYCNWSFTYGSYGNASITYHINNTNETSGLSTQTTSNRYTIKDTNFLDGLEFWCNVTNSTNSMVSNRSNISYGLIDKVVTLRAVNSLGAVISSTVKWTFSTGTYYNGNPLTKYLSNLTNRTYSGILTINITDSNANYRPIINNISKFDENSTVINYIMGSNMLALNFYKKGSLVSTNGEISDINQNRRFTNSSVVTVAENLALGRITVGFGFNNDWTNWTQFYEYDNDRTENITENLEVLDKADWITYFQVIRQSNSPIENAIIRAYQTNLTSNATEAWVNYTLIGQRITGSDGKAFFNFDSSMNAKLRITADGYEPFEGLLRIGDEDAQTKALAKKIILIETSENISSGYWVYLTNYVTNKSSNINGSIVAPNANKVEITTDYRNSNGAFNKSVLEEKYDRYLFTLIAGEDFDTSNSDIIVYIYVDDKLINTRTIKYISEKTDIFTGANLDYNLSTILVGIFLVIISGVAGRITTSTTSGFTIFMTGGCFYGGLVNTLSGTGNWFTSGATWVSLVCVLYFTGRTLTRVIKE